MLLIYLVEFRIIDFNAFAYVLIIIDRFKIVHPKKKKKI